MDKPIIGRALPLTWVVMLTVAYGTGSAGLTFGIGFCVYPFFHLAVKLWGACRSKRCANRSKRTGVRGWS